MTIRTLISRSLITLILVCITSSLSSALRHENDGQHKYWIYFTDKPAEGPYTTSYPEKTIKRRSVRGGDTNGKTDNQVNTKYCAALQSLGYTIISRSKWLNAVTLYATPKDSVQLEKLPFIEKIQNVRRYTKNKGLTNLPYPHLYKKSSADSNDSYGYTKRPLTQIQIQKLHEHNVTGAGITIGVLDTGFKLTHDIFKNISIKAQYDFIHNDTVVHNDSSQDHPDQDHHGTIVLALLAGYKSDEFIGVSYSSEYVLAKTEIIDEEIRVEEDYWIAAVEWAESLGVDVISSSIGYNDWYTYAQMDGNTAPITQVADIAAGKGVVMVIAMGNEGQDTVWPYMIAPADGDSVISVGAVDSNGTLALFSSHGPTFDGRIKPDVVAPGKNITTVDPATTNKYKQLSGTSFSAPLVAGTAALLLEINPAWTPIELRDTLRATASQSSKPDNKAGWGLVNAFKASGIESYNKARDTDKYTIATRLSFNTIKLNYTLPELSSVTLTIYALNGTTIHETFLGYKSKGLHTFTWTTGNAGLRTGLYTVIIKTDKKLLRGKLLFIVSS